MLNVPTGLCHNFLRTDTIFRNIFTGLEDIYIYMFYHAIGCYDETTAIKRSRKDGIIRLSSYECHNFRFKNNICGIVCHMNVWRQAKVIIIAWHFYIMKLLIHAVNIIWCPMQQTADFWSTGIVLLSPNKSCEICLKRYWDKLHQITHWGRDKMAAIFQTTFSNAFSWIKMYELWLKFHWSLFLWVQLAMFQHWFR